MPGKRSSQLISSFKERMTASPGPRSLHLRASNRHRPFNRSAPRCARHTSCNPPSALSANCHSIHRQHHLTAFRSGKPAGRRRRLLLSFASDGRFIKTYGKLNRHRVDLLKTMRGTQCHTRRKSSSDFRGALAKSIVLNQSATIQMKFGLIKSGYVIFPFGKYLDNVTFRSR